MRIASKILVAAFLVGLLSFMTVKASAATWWINDDGGNKTGIHIVSGNHFAVEFTLPKGQIHQILKISFYIYANPTTTFRAHIYSSDGQSNLFTAEATPVGTGWFDIDVWGYFIMVTGQLSSPTFLVTIEYMSNDGPEIGYDGYPTYLYWCSLEGTPGHWQDVGDAGNFMIRAQTEKMSFKEKPSEPTDPQHVGGELFSANKLAVISPYLALFSVVAVAAVVVKRRRT